MLSENETLREQIRSNERDNDILNKKIKSIHLEYEQRLEVAKSEVNTARDKELE